MTSDLQLQVAVLCQVVVGLALLASAILVASRTIGALRRDGGAVQTASFNLQDLWIVLVLAGFFIWASASGMARHTPTQELPNLWSIVFNTGFMVVVDSSIAGFLIMRQIKLIPLFGFDRYHFGRVLGLAALCLLAAVPFIMLAHGAETQWLKDGGDEQALVKLFQKGAAAGSRSTIGTILIAGVLFAPILEEFLFRGYFYPVLKRFIGAVGAALFTAALFAFIHGNVASLAGLFTLALALTVAYERTGSLAVPMGMHALFNLTNLTVLYFHARATAP